MSFAAALAVAAFRHPCGRTASSIATTTPCTTGTTTGGAGCGGETD